jgi:tRNA(His) 5'-end guanylyltransferase
MAADVGTSGILGLLPAELGEASFVASAATQSPAIVGEKRSRDAISGEKGSATTVSHGAEDLGDPLKAREAALEQNIPPTSAFILRLDGHSFSRFTVGLRKPFDPIMTEAMRAMTVDAMQEFQAATAYCHSDEVTLIFGPVPADGLAKGVTHAYNGRVTKLCSSAAGFCSVRFNHHFSRLLAGAPAGTFSAAHLERWMAGRAYFDGRALAFGADELECLVDHQIWRSSLDCLRNCVSTFADVHVGKRQTSGKKQWEKIALLEAAGVPYSSISDELKFGCYFKRAEGAPVTKEITQTNGVVRTVTYSPNVITPTVLDISKAPRAAALAWLLNKNREGAAEAASPIAALVASSGAAGAGGPAAVAEPFSTADTLAGAGADTS